MTTQIDRLRAVADFFAVHGLDEHVMNVNVFNADKIRIQLYTRADESAIEQILPWARVFGAFAVSASQTDVCVHLAVEGHLRRDLPCVVIALTEERETRALEAAGFGDRIAVAALATLQASGSDGAG